MDNHQLYAASERLGAPRSFLFLQGPISSFFDRLGRALTARGHRVHRINLHFGDQLFWRLPATHFRGRFDEWRDFVGQVLDRERVTDLVLHGDRRPYHIVAAEEARARNIPVIATDLGYMRPDWLTLEYDGMTTYSRFPRDPQLIYKLAENFPEPQLGPHFHTPFWLIASRDVAYNLGLVLGRLFYPHYRYHSTCHPFVEYFGWLRSRPYKLLTARSSAVAKKRLAAAPRSYFLVPLQLATDFQIRAHSRFTRLHDAISEIIASFSASGSTRSLVFVVHPLDNGVTDWHRLIARCATQHGVSDRVIALHGGTPMDLLQNAAGVITVNSTVGITALCQGIPVKTLGNAVFNVPGLTCQTPLATFWQAPPAPDSDLLAAFLRALAGTTQVKGGYYEGRSQDCAIAGFVERLEQRPYRLPAPTAAERSTHAPRAATCDIVISDASAPLGLALARRLAAPGVRLRLLGEPSRRLAQASDDCRQRGALVDVHPLPPEMPLATAAQPTPFESDTSPDLLVVAGNLAIGTGLTAPGNAEPKFLTVIEAMRKRKAGGVILVGSVPAIEVEVDAAATLRALRVWLDEGIALRRRLRVDGIGVTIVAPSGLAIRAAAILRVPRLAAASGDRVAELAARAVAVGRGDRTIMVPGGWAVLRGTFRALPAAIVAGIRALLPGAETGNEPADDTPVAEESGTGD